MATTTLDTTGTPTAGSGGLRWGTLIRMALADLRGERRNFLIFLACIALGVAAVTGVGALSDGLRAGLANEGRQLLGGDFEATRIHQRADAPTLEKLRALGTVSEVVTLRAMARSKRPAAPAASGTPQSGETSGAETPAASAPNLALAEIKAVDASYPLIGTLGLSRTRSGSPDDVVADARAALRDGPAAFVNPLLIDRLGLKIGDTFQVGDTQLRLAGVVTDEPDKLSGRAAFGPRVFVALETLEGSGLIATGGLQRWRYRVAASGPEALETARRGADGAQRATFEQSAIGTDLQGQGFELRDGRNPDPNVARAVGRLAQFLTLVGITAMLVGGVGVANAVAAYVDRKRKTIATLKSLGAPARTVVTIYILEILALTLLGIGAGLLLGYLIPVGLVSAFAGALPFEIQFSLGAATIASGVSYGILVALVFVLWPLGRSEQIAPAVLFRDADGQAGRAPRWPYIAAILASGALLASLAILTADSPKLAAGFLGGVVVLFALFLALGSLVVWLVPRLPRPRRPELALALTNLAGPGALTRSVVLSLGIGLSLLVTLALTDTSLVRELTTRIPANAPHFFVLDIPRNELSTFETRVRTTAPETQISKAPMLRGRITAINGTPAAQFDAPSEAAWVLRGDRGLTFSNSPPKGSSMTTGDWWAEGYNGEPLVSFADDLAKELGIGVGDTLTVNILGRNITARIANLRTVKFETLAINFVMIFSPNTLAGAPYNYLATVRYPDLPTTAQQAELLRNVSQQFPNATIVNVRDAITTTLSIFEKVVNAIRIAGSVTLLSGALVLAGALIVAQRRRIYQAVVLKTLGGTRARIITANLAEYALLALITAGFAVLIGVLAAYVVTTFILDVGFVLSWQAIGTALAIALGLVMVFGAFGIWQVLRAPTTPYLRAS